jgi:hypothetical protein
VTFVDVDKTSGGLATPNCPANMIVRESFKQGTEPAKPCIVHTTPTASPVVPMFDEFGNPIVTNTAGTTDTGGFEPTNPDSTLTGGVFRDPATATGGAPPPSTPPPPTNTAPPEEEPEEEPPPTDTSTTTSGPPET